jgi:formate dehydrogenase subunit delta
MNAGGENLVRMANDIGNFFRAEADREDAIAGIATHLGKFWTRKMREKLLAQVVRGETGLDELPLAALRRLAGEAAAAPGAAGAAGPEATRSD